jgi:hypothetical protein
VNPLQVRFGDIRREDLQPIEHPDLDAADANWVQFKKEGEYEQHHGQFAAELLGAREFECTRFPFQVWEISAHDKDGKAVAILRSNQSSLEGALRYMEENRILVYNRAGVEGGPLPLPPYAPEIDNRDLFEPL